ncbi:MAG: mannose-6-phosphate isomerase, partial [Saprospiraceae bacterium]|nr:mannose-6-phosphate isomerase [Saprospiraceae bacterium]
MTIPSKPEVVKLSGAVQHYDWGGMTFIPQLTGVENPEGQPFAELWMGD